MMNLLENVTQIGGQCQARGSRSLFDQDRPPRAWHYTKFLTEMKHTHCQFALQKKRLAIVGATLVVALVEGRHKALPLLHTNCANSITRRHGRNIGYLPYFR
jgi:hypothetical protein